jgi:hypothetical protein
MKRDPIVEEVRRIREQYAARFGYDLKKIYRDLKERERRGEFSVVHRSPRASRRPPRTGRKQSAARA